MMLRSIIVKYRHAASTVEKTRTFANKAAVTGIDWDAINKLVHSDAGKHELASLRATLMDVQSRFEEMAKETAPIDWDRWSKEVDPKVVEGFKKAFEGIKLPKYELPDLDAAKTKFDEILKDANEFAAQSMVRAKDIEAELDALKKEKERLATTTVEDELASDPELAKKIDEEIAKNSFLVSQ